MKMFEIDGSFKYSAIYKWENLINGKVYIGQTKNIYRRFRPYSFSNIHFKHAVDKYGIDNFDITFIETHLPEEMLDEREEYWIKYFDSSNEEKGYNIYTSANSPRGYKWSNEMKMRFSKNRKAKKIHFSECSKEKMRVAMRKQNRCKQIAQIDSKTDRVIAIFPSINEASRKTGVDKSCLIKALQGKIKKSGGFKWKEVI